MVPWRSTRSPRSGSTRPATIFKSVDLPEPLRPTSASRSPSPTVSSTSASSGGAPKPSDTFLSERSGGAAAKVYPGCFIRRACEALRRHEAVAAFDERGNLAPVRLPVEPHADPALGPDVRRHKEQLRVGADQHGLAAGRRLAPHGDAPVAALFHGEDLVAHAEGRVAPRLLLLRFREGEADGAQAVGGRLGHGAYWHAARFNRTNGPLRERSLTPDAGSRVRRSAAHASGSDDI